MTIFGIHFSWYFLSIITEIELLSFTSLSQAQAQALRDLLADVTVVNIDEDVKNAAIRLRREHRLRLPDAIIAATALSLDAELLTNDARLAGVRGLQCRPLSLVRR